MAKRQVVTLSTSYLLDKALGWELNGDRLCWVLSDTAEIDLKAKYPKKLAGMFCSSYRIRVTGTRRQFFKVTCVFEPEQEAHSKEKFE